MERAEVIDMLATAAVACTAMGKKKHGAQRITCAAGHSVSRRRFNMALRMRQVPTCEECGTTQLEISGGQYEVRGAGGNKRLIWKTK